MDVTIPNGIKHIGDNAFFNCTSLTNVIIPEEVASIGDNVFENCDSLQNITLPNGITSIGDYAFSCCVSLKDIHIPESVTSIGNHTFENCSTISSIILPDGITSIGDYAFSFCTNLLDIKLSENVNSIGECAFAYCENIEKIIIPQNRKIIGNNAFESCMNLSDITISNGVTNIGAEAFQGCVSISNLTIPESIVSVGNNAFGGCTSLNTVFYNAINCTNMGSRYYPVFYGCENLTTLEIGDNVKTIPILSFNGCDKLTSITIPEGVTNIGKFAFNECDSITTLNYNAVNCEAIGEYNIEENTYSAVFGGCSSLKEVNIGPNVKTIPDGTFSWCDAIEKITIPENITSIGRSAFQDCINLRTVNYNAIDCVMGYYDKENNTLNSVFLGCNSLSEINVGKDVVRIPIGAFAWCYGVTQITIPETVLEIGRYAFYKCDNIETINYEGSKNDWENIIFNNNIFDNAIINYNQPIPDQGHVITPVPITTIEVLKTDIDNGTAYNFNISVGKTYENSSIYIAIFDGDNNLINVQTEKLNMYDSTDVKVNKAYGQKTAKIFVWNNKMQPITEITTIELI